MKFWVCVFRTDACTRKWQMTSAYSIWRGSPYSLSWTGSMGLGHRR